VLALCTGMARAVATVRGRVEVTGSREDWTYSFSHTVIWLTPVPGTAIDSAPASPVRRQIFVHAEEQSFEPHVLVVPPVPPRVSPIVSLLP